MLLWSYPDCATPAIASATNSTIVEIIFVIESSLNPSVQKLSSARHVRLVARQGFVRSADVCHHGLQNFFGVLVRAVAQPTDQNQKDDDKSGSRSEERRVGKE